MAFSWHDQNHYFCLSSDTKPVLDSTQTGATLVEVDTNNEYWWNGTAWAEKLDKSSVYVWDTGTLDFVAMEQPVISTDTLNVTLTGVATAANQTNADQKTGLVDAAKASINPAKEDGNLATIAAGVYSDFPTGTSANGTTTLTLADTAYAVLSSPPAARFVLNVSNISDTNIYIGYANSNSGGILLKANGGSAEILLGASQTPYAYCASAGKVLSYTYKVL